MKHIELTANLEVDSSVGPRMGRILGLGTSMVGNSGQGINRPSSRQGAKPTLKIAGFEVVASTAQGKPC